MGNKLKIIDMDGMPYLYIKREEFKAGDTLLTVEYRLNIFRPSLSVKILSITGAGAYYSFVPLFSSRHRLLCYNYCDAALRLRDHDFYRNALIMGCGGGAIPRWILEEYPNVSVDVVDYSKEIIAVCKKYFLNKWKRSDRLTYYCTDAKDFESPGHKYQFIFCDLFDGVTLAPFVYERSFAEKLAEMLADDGLLVINCGWEHLNDVLRSYKDVFKYMRVVKRDSWQTQAVVISDSL